MKNIALAILAHPDDVEFLCAGTLIRLHREQAWEIHIASMTPGDCGSVEYGPEEIARLRRGEGAAAAQSIGGVYHCLEERDLRVIYNEPALEKVVRLINMVRPSVVFTHSPDDYHLDHEQTSKLVRAATFAAPIPNFLHTRPHAAELHPPLEHIPHVYYCDPLEGVDSFGQAIAPAFRIDVSRVIDEKGRMLDCHESQRAWLRKHHEVDNLVESMKEWGATQGKAAGVAYAEGFRQHLGHSYPKSNLIADLLGRV